MPEVSIIMNCLNGEKYLQEALDSVKNQTFQDYEIIFLDNGSTDNSPQIAKSFDSRLKYLANEKTVPLGMARNLAIAAAKGNFVAFLDCDDLWEPTKLARQMALMQADPEVGLVTTDTLVFNSRGPLYRLFDQAPPARGIVFDDLLLRQWVSMSSALLRRSALDSIAEAPEKWFDESLNVCEEADLFYRIAHDHALDFVPEALTSWRVHQTNTTFEKFGQFAKETRAILGKHCRIYPQYEEEHSRAFQILTERAAFQEAISLWRNGEGSKARERLKPHRSRNKKYALFHLLTFFPGVLFDPVARLYFALPRWVRK